MNLAIDQDEPRELTLFEKIVEQVTLRTWWFDGESSQPSREIKPETVALRNQVLAWLRTQGRKVKTAEIQQQFSINNSRLWHLIDPLVAAGQVRKIMVRRDLSLLEAVKETTEACTDNTD